jgi:hypothetical protein
VASGLTRGDYRGDRNEVRGGTTPHVASRPIPGLPGRVALVERGDTTSSGERVDWLVAVSVGGAGALLIVVTSGLAAALIGAFRPVVVGMTSIGLVALVGVVATRGASRATIVWRAGPIVALTAVGIVVFAAFEARFAAEHLLTDRDPGVYVTTAKWLASRGTLLIDGAVGGFEGIPSFDGIAQGYYAVPSSDALYAQFQHGIAVAMGAAGWVGGDWLMLKSVGLMSGAAIASFYAFSRVLLSRGWACAATATMSACLVTVHFGRDAYSELLLMVFLFAGLWLLDRARRSGSAMPSLLAGLMLGGTAMVRIDAWLALAGVVAFIFVDTWMAGPGWRGRARSVGLPLAGGMAVTGGFGIVDLVVSSPEYLADLMPNVVRLGFVMALVLTAGVVTSALVRPWNLRADDRVRRWQRIAADTSVAVVIGGSLFLFLVRPVLLVERSGAMVDTIEYYQRLEGLPLDGTRRYWEMSMQWLAWYLGVGGLAIGASGWAWSAREAILGRARRVIPFLFVFSIVTVAFLIRPANTPDHLWMMRRFLPIVIPGFVLLGFVAVHAFAGHWQRMHGRLAGQVAAGALTAVMMIPTAAFTLPLARSTTQVGMYGITSEVCEVVGNDAVLFTANELRMTYQPAVRSFCEVPTAGSTAAPSFAEVAEASRRWRAEGRGLVVASTPREVCDVPPLMSRFIWYPEPERTLTRRPSQEVSSRFGIALYRVEDFGDDADAFATCIGHPE